MKFNLFALPILALGEFAAKDPGQASQADITGSGIWASDLGKWLIIGVTVLIGIKTAFDFYKDHFKEQPPVQKQIDDAIEALRAELAKATEDKIGRSEMTTLIESAIMKHELSANKAGSGSREKIYERLGKLERELPALQATLAGLEKLVSEYHAEVTLFRAKR